MAMDGAAANGHLDVVKWLHWNRHEGCTTTAMDRAAANGHLEVVQWLHTNRSEGCTTFAMDKAASRAFHLPSCYNRDSMQCCQKLAPLSFQANQLAIVQWLSENRTEGCTTRAMDGAAANGDLEMVQWLHHNTEADCTENAMKDTAASGHIHVVRWLHNIRLMPCSENIMKKAAADGNLEMTKWLQANYPHWEPEIAMNEAARYGHLSVIRWLLAHCAGARLMPLFDVEHGHGYTEDVATTVVTIGTGSLTFEFTMSVLAVVNIVLQTNFPTNIPEAVISIISDFLIPDCSLASAIKSGISGSVALMDLIWAKSLRDAKRDQWTVAKLLQCEPHYYRWEFSQALLLAVCREDRGVIEWLDVHFPECPVTGAVVEKIASRGWLWLLQLLMSGRGQNRLEFNSQALNNAAINGHWDVVHWLVENTSDAMTRKSRLVNISVSTNNLEELTWLMERGNRGDYNWSKECPEREWPARKRILILLLQQTDWLVESALSQAAQHGDIHFAKWVIAHYYTATGNSAQHTVQYSAKTASKYGRVVMLRWLLKRLRGKCDLSEVMFVAAENGQVEVVKWLCKKFAKKSSVDLFRRKQFAQPGGCSSAMDVAASQGHLEVLQILQNVRISSRNTCRLYPFREQRQQPQCSSWAMDSAAFAGHLNVVQWLHFNRSEGCTKAAMDKAAVNRHLEVVKWLSKNRSEGCSSWALEMVASKSAQGSNEASKDFYKKQLEIIQWMYQSRESCTSMAMDGAAANGNMEMLKWLHENTSAGFTSKAMDMAAENGHLNIIQWLHSKYSTCTTAAMDNAAGNGHLDIVKWLHVNRSKGCTHAAMDRAAANGHLNVLIWLHNNRTEGCTADAMAGAGASGNFKVVKWLLANRSESVAFTALVKAAQNGHLRLVRYLAPRCTSEELVREDIIHEHFEVVLFLHALYIQRGGVKPILWNISSNDIELLSWKHENSDFGERLRILLQR